MVGEKEERKNKNIKHLKKFRIANKSLKLDKKNDIKKMFSILFNCLKL